MDSWTRQPLFLLRDSKKEAFYNSALATLLPLEPSCLHVVLSQRDQAEEEIVPNLAVSLDQAAFYSLQKVLNSLCLHGFDLSVS